VVESGIWLGGVVLGEKEVEKAHHKRGKDKNRGKDKDKDQRPLIRNIPIQARRDNPKICSGDSTGADTDMDKHDRSDIGKNAHDLGMHAHVVLELGQRLLTILKLQ